MTKQGLMICPKAKECPYPCIGHEKHKYEEDCDNKISVTGLPEGWVCPACIPVEPEPTCPDCNGKGINPFKFPDAICPCGHPKSEHIGTYNCQHKDSEGYFTCLSYHCSTPAEPDSRKVEQPTPTEQMPLIEADSKFESARFYHGATLQRDADMAWHNDWVAAMTRQQQDLMPTHDAEVASKARAEFAERIRKALPLDVTYPEGSAATSWEAGYQSGANAMKSHIDKIIRAMAEEGR